jgi:hypothetical protein
MIALLESYGAKNMGSGRVCVSVIADLKILRQASGNLEAISEPDQLTNASVGCCV